MIYDDKDIVKIIDENPGLWEAWDSRFGDHLPYNQYNEIWKERFSNFIDGWIACREYVRDRIMSLISL